ncbi:MAG TPA: hypothetical protein PKD45_03985 [Flavobacteriales bacterium]|nr:hypothetical protein [Flavobacteriales bacterium]
MWRFLRENSYTVGFLILWLVVAKYAALLMYVLLPLGVILLRRIDRWQDILFGFIMVLVLSDAGLEFPGMLVFKSAKSTYILVLALILFVDQARMYPLARLFTLFLPFFFYAMFPIIRNETPLVSAEKTLSYALLFLVVPNYVLYNFRLYKWDFFRNLVWFLVFVLVSQQLLPYFGNTELFYLGGRFRGWFGNPNGMAIFTFLTLVLFTVVNHLHRGLFTRWEVLFIQAVLFYYIITCGARTSLMSSLMFLMFIQFFRISTALGIISFVAFIGITELLASNLPYIITSLGLEEYMRVDTIASGSGRYVAWNYAWEQINARGDLLFGAGFEHEYNVFYAAWRYLSSLGHQGGVHNSYLALWLNVGLVGLFLYFRSFVLAFIKAAKNTSMALAAMFSVLFSIIYESWLAGSLNPYTILLLVILTMMSEDEIIGSLSETGVTTEETTVEETPGPEPQPLILPAR